MGIDPARGMAERVIDDIWSEDVRYFVIVAPPMRAGRGRLKSPSKGRRLANRREMDRWEVVSQEVLGDLSSGSPDAATTTRERICEAGLEEFIRVAESRDEVIDACADYYGEGLFIWGSGPAGGAGARIVEVIFMKPKQMT